MFTAAASLNFIYCVDSIYWLNIINMAHPNFNTELFIMEIQKRPSIWDFSCEEYRNKDIKKKHWEEIMRVFGSKGLSNKEKKKLGISLRTRWKSIRDSYNRELRRLKKCGAAALRKSAYTYTNQLSFLNNRTARKRSKTQDTSDLVFETTEEPEETKSKNIEKEISRGDDFSLNALEHREKTVIETRSDADRLFLLSLLPYLEEVPEDRKLKTKLELMNVIKNSLDNAYGETVSSQEVCRSTPG